MSLRKCFLDTEGCGLVSPSVIVQYAYDDGPILIHNFWKTPAIESMKLIESFCECAVIGFNLAFDWFHLSKIYTMFSLLSDLDSYPEDHIDFLGENEVKARDGVCIKPASACDLMLVARKTKYQITMNRSDIKIRRVPTPIAWLLAGELEERVILNNILFARRKDKFAPKWIVQDSKTQQGKTDPNFKDVVLKFKPSVALKALAVDALNESVDDILTFSQVEVEKRYWPLENKFAPFATSISNKENHWYGKIKKGTKDVKGYAWPMYIKYHIAHWEHNVLARKYAAKDVDYTRRLYTFFDSPDVGDDDSVLACAVGSVRWKGYSVNLEGIKQLKKEAHVRVGMFPTAPSKVKAYICEVLDPIERAILDSTGTKRVVLEDYAKRVNLPCPFCENHPENKVTCIGCNGVGTFTHPAAQRAKDVLETRFAKKEIELYDKLLLAGRFHASFRVIGTLSSRMSGADGLNPQGIKRSKYVRSKFTFSDTSVDLYGGDFDAFEMTLADAAYKDPDLRRDLLKKGICPGCLGLKTKKGIICDDCKGEGQTSQKIHGLFGMELFPGHSYSDVVQSKGSAFDMYDYGKRGVFSLIYGGNENTLVKKLGVSLDVAVRATKGFFKKYPTMYKARERVFNSFCSMRQEGGIGSKVTWHEPDDYVESLFGFRRYFTLENQIAKAIFTLANKTPDSFKQVKVKVMRRDRIQTAAGATQSALYAAAFGLQAANMRAAANHEIQSSGAQVTKYVQRKIWDVQPIGPHKWIVQPCNIHDEILSPTDKDFIAIVEQVVYESVEVFRSRVPLISMEWKKMNNWAEK